MKKTNCKTCQNTECFIKLYCTADWVEKIEMSKFQTFFKKNQNIINEGFPVLGIYFIQEGKVKVISTGFNGRQQIVRFAFDGHILGHRGLGNDIYPISAVAMEDSLICFVRNDTLNDLFRTNPKFTTELMMFYSRELRKMEDRMKNMAHMSIREKSADALLSLSENFSLSKSNEINVPLTRLDIANTAGTTVEQVSRQLTDFEEEGLIEKRGKKIAILDIEGLRKITAKHKPSVKDSTLSRNSGLF